MALPFPAHRRQLQCQQLLPQGKSLQEDRKQQSSLLEKREGCMFLEVYSRYLLERLHK